MTSPEVLTPTRLAAPVPAAGAPIQPVFLLSAPRSGSTLVQRMLAAHPGVATAAEPWLLLPLLGARREDLPDVTGWHWPAAVGVEHFIADYLPGGIDDYDAAIRAAALQLYRRAAGPQASHFVDKTPGYALIADDLARTFPDAPLIFLWRNPLGILASIVETFDAGAFRPYHQALPLFDGPARMVAAQQRLGDRVTAVRYEDVVAGDEATLRRLSAGASLQFTAEAYERFADVQIPGRLGDPTGVHRYSSVSREPTEKWRTVLANPARRAWARRWVRWLGRERLAVMGYDLDAVLDQLDELGTPAGTAPQLARDSAGLAVSMLRDTLKARAAFPSTSTWRCLLST
ncbi:sulfotransferase [Svornostia abyssi]|uniref:Sulfotransferase n=1 Tax=Svornostia abyssi TaxID=2898438 RepID=A0ABY5PFW4_9ACTN|nr:sulfotransferase [Parviterribacteraceae bacterium J379]